MKSILVTGFDAFGGEQVNPAERILNLLPSQIQDWQIHTSVLPTVFYDAAQVLKEKVDQVRPCYLISLGQAGGRSMISLERIAINLDDARIADNKGQAPIDQAIELDGPAAYFSTIPIKRLLNRLVEVGIPVSISNSAGTYVCNHVMYQGLHLQATTYPEMRVGFIHIPYLPEQVSDRPHLPSMSQQMILEGITTVLEELIASDGLEDIKITGGKEV